MASLVSPVRQLSTVDENPTLTVHGTVGTSNLPCNLTRGVQVLSTLQATQETEAIGERRALEISLVIDKSGSMGGDKIKLVQQTLELLEKQLGLKDSVSLVTFDTNVQVVFPMAKMNTTEAKAKYIRCVKAIRAGTSTNLSGGLSEGISELKKSTQTNVVRAVILLTDGHANHGITDMDQLARMTTSAVEGTGITLFTYGYGKDHSANALQSLSQATDGGGYYFVEQIDSVGSALGDALGGLLSVCAQNIKLRATAAAGVKITKVRAPNRTVEEVAKGIAYEVKFGDLYAGERRDILFQVEVDPSRAPEANFPLIRFDAEYVDAIREKISLCEATVTIARVEDGEEDHTLNPTVVDHICRLNVSENMLAANRLADVRKYVEARQLMAASVKFCEEHLAHAQTKELVTNLISDCKRALQAMQDQHQWAHSGGGHTMKSKMQEHCVQRCTSSAVHEFSSYRTSSKKAFATNMSTPFDDGGCGGPPKKKKKP